MRSVPCSGIKRNGEPCGKKTRDPSGTCSDHRHAQAALYATGSLSLSKDLDASIGMADSLDGSDRNNRPPKHDASPKTPFDYQHDAVDSIMQELYGQNADRCQVQAACGTGKTVMAQEAIRRHHEAGHGTSGVYVFVTSSIALTKQTRDDFIDDQIVPETFDGFSLHHESEELKRARANKLPDETNEDADLRALRDFIEEGDGDPKIIFTTYESHDKVSQVQKMLQDDGLDDLAQADMTILDETHRLSGDYDIEGKKRKKGEEQTHTDTMPNLFYNEVPGALQSEKRVFLTATPKIRTVYDEDNYSGVRPNRATVTEFLSAQAEGRPVDPRFKAMSKSGLKIRHTDQELYGKRVFGMGMKEAVERGALVKPIMHRQTARVDTGGQDFDPYKDHVSIDGRKVPKGKDTLTGASYASTVAAIELIASGDGHNVMIFQDSIKESDSVSSSFSAIARHMAGGDRAPSPSEARSRLEANPDDRQARYALIAEHARCVSAHSSVKDKQLVDSVYNSSVEEDGSYTGFFDPDTGYRGQASETEPGVCPCGKPGGGWCACARVVSNVNFFGEGVSVKSIDTVVIGSQDKMGDTQFTQAAGRAMRRWDAGEKRSGNIVIPDVGYTDEHGNEQITSEMSGKPIMTATRMYRDTNRAAFDGTRHAPGHIDHSGIETYDNGRQVSAYDAAVSAMPDPYRAYLISAGWNRIKAGALTSYDDAHGRGSFSKLSKQEQEDVRRSFLQNYNGDDKDLQVLREINPSERDLENARRRIDQMNSMVDSYDKQSLNDEERAVMEATGKLQNGRESRVKAPSKKQSLLSVLSKSRSGLRASDLTSRLTGSP